MQSLRCVMVAVCLGLVSALAQATVGLKIVQVQWDARDPLKTSAVVQSLGLDAVGIALGNHGAWGQVMDAKDGLCPALRAQLTKANGLSKGVSAYPDKTWACRIGEMQNLQLAASGKHEVTLSFQVPGNHLEAKFTQPSAAGSFADPYLAIDWSMDLSIVLRKVVDKTSGATLLKWRRRSRS